MNTAPLARPVALSDVPYSGCTDRASAPNPPLTMYPPRGSKCARPI